MHTLLLLASLPCVLLSSALLLGLLSQLRDWSQRRTWQRFVLAMPLFSLALGLCDLCLHGITSWDALFSEALPLVMGGIALGALSLGIFRLVLLRQVMARAGGRTAPELQARVHALAQQLHCPPPQVLLCRRDQPMALTYGLRTPAMLLSTWMIEHLDERELEAVLIHELEHVARHDFFSMWVVTVLRDAFFYMPTSQIAYHQIRQEKELACDDVVVSITHRPLALASALAKVWLQAMHEPACGRRFITAQPLIETEKGIESRIKRLLTASKPPAPLHLARPSVLRMSVVVLATCLLPGFISVVLMVLLMGCGPVLFLGQMP